MKITALLSAALLIATASLTSCKKTDLLESTGLTSGKSSISFTTGSDFGGSTSYGSGALRVSNATFTPSGDYTEYSIGTGDNSGSNVRVADLLITLPTSAGTAGGGIVTHFGNGASDSTGIPILTISTATSTGSDPKTYTSVSGTLTITRLSSTEIEGTFSGEVAENENPANKLTISNGKFSSKK